MSTSEAAGTILETAKSLVTGDRKAQHGDAAKTYAVVARLWSAKLGIEINAAEVLELMALLKIGRPPSNPDNWTDACGYIALAGAVRQSRDA